MKQLITNLTLTFWLSTLSLNANAERWFEVEMIAFEQQPTDSLREDFSLVHPPIEGKRQLDLLSEGFNTQGQQRCLEGDPDFDPRPFIQQMSNAGNSWGCDASHDYIARYDTLPVSPYADSQEHMDNIYLLSKQQLKFEDVLKKLQRRGLKPILHTGWRFPEQSQRKAPFMKIFAGKRFKSPVSQRLLDTIEQNGYLGLLDKRFNIQTEADEDHWQLEGLIKIHVKHYLYVTSNLDIRYLMDDGDTQKARMSQFTRVYSGDIHYLDHPKLGIIFQIRKYKH
ncbi:CsiV family protein [Pseudoalteromonas sp. MMG022]|uniref:CsiV family protein n=1 Tax=Pseudoalteromonas sp. MMG022 TaxID=2909978 RepID=UPI001F2F51E8|nr:CsiV family protein [Pseudoalteromonas sp. MMG022]MCF6436952.1 peptidoglycan binding protein CsiV [Pseudoalteromonas sp. MMG022]